MKNTIGIIGAGNMGGSFYKGIIKEFPDEKIFVCDKDIGKLEALNAKNFSTDPNVIIKKVDTVILAVKPQSIKECVENLEESLAEKLIISIMAGVSLEKLKKLTGSKRIIRSMPNLPIQVEMGLIGWIATEDINDNEKGFIRRIFSTLGNAIELSNESKIDAITALSGSGPAYYYFLCELMTRKAKELGFSKEEAREIAERTFVGCAHLLDTSNKTANFWREAVTSKGGTTEAALKFLGKNKVDKLFYEAVDVAIKRSKELNQ